MSKSKTSKPVSNFNKAFLTQEGVTVRGRSVVSANSKNITLDNGTRLSSKGERAVYNPSKVSFGMLSSSGGDTAGDDC
jgi:hypothetical protein